jgi:hypothetical protein
VWGACDLLFGGGGGEGGGGYWDTAMRNEITSSELDKVIATLKQCAYPYQTH